jgi:hypothetical protein
VCRVTCVTCCCSGEGAANVERRCEHKLPDHRRKKCALLERTTEHMHKDVFAVIRLSQWGEKREIIKLLLVSSADKASSSSCWLLAAMLCFVGASSTLFNTASVSHTYFFKQTSTVFRFIFQTFFGPCGKLETAGRQRGRGERQGRSNFGSAGAQPKL